jgi:hypothetical protein
LAKASHCSAGLQAERSPALREGEQQSPAAARRHHPSPEPPRRAAVRRPGKLGAEAHSPPLGVQGPVGRPDLSIQSPSGTSAACRLLLDRGFPVARPERRERGQQSAAGGCPRDKRCARPRTSRHAPALLRCGHLRSRRPCVLAPQRGHPQAEDTWVLSPLGAGAGVARKRRATSAVAAAPKPQVPSQPRYRGSNRWQSRGPSPVCPGSRARLPASSSELTRSR